MATTVGRLRPDGALEGGWKYVLPQHPHGRSLGAILVAEHLVADGYIS